MFKFVKAVTLTSLLVALSLLWTACTVTVAPPNTTVTAAENMTIPAPENEAEMEAMEIEAQPAETPKLAGISPDDAIAPTGEWTTITNGEQHWFTFHHDFDADITEPIEIQMYTDPQDSAILRLLNREQVQLWNTEGKLEYFGDANIQEYDPETEERPDHAVWIGQLFSTGTYHIMVETAKDFEGTASYRFTMNGPNLSFPEAAVEPAAIPPAAVEAPSIEIEARLLTGLEGSGPDNTLVPTGEWTEVKRDEYHWYAFDYDFDEDYGDFEIRLYSEPADGAILLLLNREQAQLWRSEGELEYFGNTAVAELQDEDAEEVQKADYANWLGHPGSSGTYYIVVKTEKNVDGPVAYRFTIEGEGVSY